MSTATFDGVAYRVRDGRPEHRPLDSARYAAMRPMHLLALPVDSEAWRWLRGQGVRRPSPPGTPSMGKTTPENSRSTVAVKLRLAPAEAEDLSQRATKAGIAVSHYVARELRLGGTARDPR